MCGDEMSAKKSIEFSFNCSTKKEIEDYLNGIRESIQTSRKSYGILSVWRCANKMDKRGTMIGCVLAFAMAFSGIAGCFFCHLIFFFAFAKRVTCRI